MNFEYTTEIAIWLSLKDALVGEIDNNLRMVAVNWNEKSINISFYFDKEISVQNLNSVHNAISKIAQNFDKKIVIIPNCIHLDYPFKLPYYDNQVFRRKEE